MATTIPFLLPGSWQIRLVYSVLFEIIPVLIRKFFQIYDKFSQKRTKLDLDVFDHYQELRFQIDEHRERLKERIDDIALAMIDKVFGP